MKKERIFIIEYHTSNYEPKDLAIRKHHSKLFKGDNYTFYADDDLIKSMPFEFICKLKSDKFTSLPNKWLKNVKSILKKAEVNLIKQMKLFRLLRANECDNNQLIQGNVLYMKLSW